MNNIQIKKLCICLKTIQDMIRWTISQFNKSNIFYGHGTNNSFDESIKLVLGSIDVSFNLPNYIYNSNLTYNEKKIIIKRVKKRIKYRIPLPYIINKTWFCNIEFYIDKRVLIPRSPIGEILLKKINRMFFLNKPNHILDLCTGSGAIAIACSYIFKKSIVDAVDICSDALSITELNIKKHFMEKKVFPIKSNLFSNLPTNFYDLIITNPPYVKRQDIKNLPKEFFYEPIKSLDGGKDGLFFIKKILYFASKYLNKNGILICEVGYQMLNLIKKYPKVPFKWIKLFNGGEGIFYLNYFYLNKYKKYFIN
ncbi:50S ribosomal protein L3 N(5)-glutamine methyltransferase [Sodalis-like secondary symbiont of Drepanosiphum platanoidis]|uniref:50S ribosomal protein L3 N(5)-glutamine methyltransferase n=1 Tax=Sodalis-like secondary symbiont of Drepanosiphum platanoidis TaxID=2994493 RepID=UPI00346492E3